MRIKSKDNIEVFCKYCELAMPIVSDSKMVCPKYGVVAADYHCRKFVYDPLKRDPKRASVDIEGLEFPAIEDNTDIPDQ